MDAAPVFVKINDYKGVLDVVDVLKAKLLDAKDTLQKIQQLKAEEDKELQDWANNIDDISRKLQMMDKTLFEPDMG